MAESLGNLANKSKAQLVAMVNDLANENAVLKEIHKFVELTNKRLEKLEREQNRSLQYNRRNNIEISGIPANIPTNDLEKEVIKLYQAADITVHGQKLAHRDIEACHRIGKKNVTIVRYVNRKFAREGLWNGKNLKGKNVYGADSAVYINNSFCNEYRHINFLIRKAKKDGKIHHWKVRNGINMVKVAENEEYVEITHRLDLVQLDIIADID